MKLAACLLLAPLLAASTAPRRVLLLGNSAYQHLPAMRTPRANVDALKDALSKMQTAAQVAYDLTQAALLDSVQRFIDSVQPGDFVLIYFSGYGYQDAASGLNYLLPVNFDPRDRMALNSKALSLRRLESQLDERKAGTRMLLLDASRQAEGLPTGLAAVRPRGNTVVSFAAAENQVAPDPPNGGVDLWTDALIHALEASGSTVSSVANRAYAEVIARSEGKQLPYVMMQAPGDEVILPLPVPVSSSPPARGMTPTNPQPSARRPGETKINPADGLTYVWVPSGSFQMGCSNGDSECQDNEKPAHWVSISQGFWIGQTEVTQEAYEKITKTNPSQNKGSKLPVESINWQQANQYCVAVQMRLPTEAEWEYAARAGSAGSRYDELDQIAWYLLNSENQPHEVAGKQPNAWGLYDMLGNVWEWVLDFYEDYKPDSVTDPRGPAETPFGDLRRQHGIRGGAKGTSAQSLRVSLRGGNVRALIGVRCAGN